MSAGLASVEPDGPPFRLGNWAIFEPPPDSPSPFVTTTSPLIHVEDADLQTALDLLGLALV